MNRIVVLTILLAVGIAAASLHPLGYSEEDLAATAPEHEVHSIPVAPGVPAFAEMSYVDLSDELPPVGNQGSIGSCVSWGVAYYHRTQLEYRERGWDLTDPNHQFSPSFVYNQVNGGVDGGSGFGNNMPLIVEQGVASLADCPYTGSYTSWPSESAYARAIPFRCRNWAWFDTEDSAGVNMIKQLLVNGSTVPIGIDVWGNFDAITRYNNMYCSSERTGENRGGHVVTILGYDDTLTTADGTGAFRLVNSWGRGWGDGGFFWMSYEAVLDSFLCHQVAGFLTDTVGYEPSLLARVKIAHPTRDRVGIGFMVGPRSSPLWYYSFRTWRRARADQPFPDNNMVFDLSEAAGYIANRTTDSVYVVCIDGRRDGRDGTIEFMGGQYLPWGNVFPSDHTPVPIPDNGGTVYAGSRVGQFDNDAAIRALYGPCGLVTPDSAYIPTATVTNFGRNTISFPVILHVGDGYADTVNVNGLSPFDTARVVFRTWTSPTRGGCSVRCSTALSGDQYSYNDLAAESVHSRLNDVQVLEIVCPADTVDSGAIVRPRVRVRNNGTQSESFDAFFRIPDEGYLSRANRMLAPDTVVEMSFGAWIPKLRGTRAMSCTLALAGDMDPGNDLISGSVHVGPPTGVAEEPTAVFGIDRASPSLFAGQALLDCALPAPGRVSLDVIDAAGVLVRSLVRSFLSAGRHRVTWDGRDQDGREAPAGLYFCRLVAGRKAATATLLKVR